MTKLEKIKAAMEVLQTWRVSDMSGRVFYDYLIDELQSSCESEWKDRAERAEAALVEAQERALKFERMLIAEEARKDAEPVLDKYRVLRTAMDISSQNTRTKSIAILSYHSIRLFLLEICGGTYTENVYRWK